MSAMPLKIEPIKSSRSRKRKPKSISHTAWEKLYSMPFSKGLKGGGSGILTTGQTSDKLCLLSMEIPLPQTKQ